MSNTPTDAELKKLAEECGIGWGAGLGGMDDFLSAFARAVLAKWGTPQPTTAKFALQALVAAGHVSQELVDKALVLPGAPQPVVREALTQGQIESLLWTYGYAPDDAQMAAMLQAARGIVQKGGSNADTGTN